MSCKYCYSPYNSNYIAETKNWYIYLVPQSNIIGRCMIVLKRHHDDLSKLTINEQAEFQEIVKRMEKAIHELYTPNSFDWSVPADEKRKIIFPNSHVHWHLKPNYSSVKKHMNNKIKNMKIKNISLLFKDVYRDKNKILQELQSYLVNNLNSPLT